MVEKSCHIFQAICLETNQYKAKIDDTYQALCECGEVF